MPRMLFRKWGGDLGRMLVLYRRIFTIKTLETLYLGVRIVERDAQRVLRELPEVLFGAWIIPHFLYQAVSDYDLADCHGLLGHISSLSVLSSMI